LCVAPMIPTTWPGFTAIRIFRGVTYHIAVTRKGPGNTAHLVADGKPVHGTVVPLPPVGTHDVRVEITLA